MDHAVARRNWTAAQYSARHRYERNIQRNNSNKDAHSRVVDRPPNNQLGSNHHRNVRCKQNRACNKVYTTTHTSYSNRLAMRNSPPTAYTTIRIPHTINILGQTTMLKSLTCDKVCLETPIPTSVKTITSNRRIPQTTHKLDCVLYVYHAHRRSHTNSLTNCLPHTTINTQKLILQNARNITCLSGNSSIETLMYKATVY
jgi:hypothetical protein